MDYYGFYLYNSPYQAFWPLITIFGGLMALMTISPFLTKPSSDEIVWNFQYQMVKQAITAGVVSLILLLSIGSIIFSLYYLFSWHPGNIPVNIFIITATIISPLLFMSGIPQHMDESPPLETGQWLFKLMNYIIIPVIFIYSVLLHVYCIKILIMQDLPRGKVSYLVMAFGVIMVLAHLVTIRWKKINDVIRLFWRYAAWLMFIPLGLMAWGMWVRISSFGLTEPRCVVVLCWVWLVFSTLVFITRAHYPSRRIFECLSFLLLGSALNPYNIERLAVDNQIAGLQKSFHQFQTQGSQGKEEIDTIRSILIYLDRLGQLDQLKNIPNLDEFSSFYQKFFLSTLHLKCGFLLKDIPF